MVTKRKVISLFSVILVQLSLVTVALAANVPGNSKPVTATQSDIEWASYTDPRFDFNVDYPKSWTINPRNDHQSVIATLSFSEEFTDVDNHADPHDSPLKVVIGLYLVAWSDQESVTNSSLKEWADLYNELSTVPEAKERSIDASRYFQVDKHKAIYEEGEGTFSKIRYVNVPRGDIVWFIWSNGETDTDIAIFDEMVASFKFGENTPLTLQQVYGNNFQPLPLIQKSNEDTSTEKARPNTGYFISPQALGSSWRSPLNGNNLEATCNSAAHNPVASPNVSSGRSKYAIDVARPAWTTEVYSAKSGNVPFAGWDNSGFGLLYKIENGTKTAYNAHLAGIHFPRWWNWFVGQGQLIGWVGSTGNSTGSHLHFEVRENNTSISLIGMSGFTATNYPYPGNPCGTLTYP